jgi:DNA adenine methylase
MKVIQPIRYPGGKSRVVKKYIKPGMPKYSGDFYEPFIGAGSLSLYEARCHPEKTININDLNFKLICLWREIKNNNLALRQELHAIRDEYDPEDPERAKPMAEDMKKRAETEDPFQLAVSYFVMNKIAFSGLENGSISKHNYKYLFNHKKIEKMEVIGKAMKNIVIHNIDYRELIKKAKADDFVFLDPPYEIEDFLYGKDGKLHEGFNHDDFAEATKKLPCKWMITYNDNQLIRNRFKDYYIYDKSYKYCMAFEKKDDGKLGSREKNELVITNYEIKGYNNTVKPSKISKFFKTK